MTDRKERYRGRCTDCGARTHGQNGPGKAPKYCRRCIPRHRSHCRWDREKCIDALRRWYEIHGHSPRWREWNAAGDEYPGGATVQKYLGLWSEALAAAGLPARAVGQNYTAEEKEAAVRLWREGNEPLAIAERFGVARRTLLEWVNEAGFGRRRPPQLRLPGLYKRYPIDPETRWRIWERDDFTCQECGARRYLSIDHIVPVVGGGTDDDSNLRTLCRPCNSAKCDTEMAA
jgi:hypothetical protein